jgi:hypothetical protein
MDYRPVPDTLYRNNGDGTFNDVSDDSRVAGQAGTGMGMVCADYDNDGDTDIFVLNDDAANFVLENNGSGKFSEVGLFSGLAYDGHGQEQGNMGVDCGDYDNDGLLDFYATSYQRQPAILYRNLGDGVFEDVTADTGAGTGTLPHVTWGNSLVDLDNDGNRDIFVACGHLQDNIERYDDSSTYHARNIVLRNTGKRDFENVSDRCGDGLEIALSSRGAGFDDLDNDGDVDVVILNSRHEPTLLCNESPTRHHWLQVRLRGVRSSRDGVGAHVCVLAGGVSQMAEVHSGRGYQSHYGSRLHFGLGAHQWADRIEVHWIGGGVDVLRDVPADRVVHVVEGGG